MRPDEKWFSRKTAEILRDIVNEQPITLTELAKRAGGDVSFVLERIRVLKKFGFGIRIMWLDRIANPEAKVVKQKHVGIAYLRPNNE
jgi:predicted transcriptional regulator